MRKITFLFMVCACILAPASARADDGGWIDWLERMSGPRLIGYGTDFHLCLGEDGKPVKCEFWFHKIPEGSFSYSSIKHQFDLRTALYRSVGYHFGDTKDTNGPNEKGIWAVKLMGLYHYSLHPGVDLGAGIGIMPFFGPDTSLTSRLIVTPISLVYGPKRLNGVTIRVEESYLTSGFTGKDFGDALTNFSTTHERVTSVAFGIDLRHRHW